MLFVPFSNSNLKNHPIPLTADQGLEGMRRIEETWFWILVLEIHLGSGA